MYGRVERGGKVKPCYLGVKRICVLHAKWPSSGLGWDPKLMIQGQERLLVEAALDELLRWEELKRSPQLSEFLRYVVERTLDGEESSLKAYSIAVDVLGRPIDFDPQSDPIVRVQAARLRSLLERYYGARLNLVPMRIEIPLGRYVPKFSELTPATGQVMAADEAPLPPSDQGVAAARTRRRTMPVFLAMMLLTAIAVGALSMQFFQQRSDQTPREHVGILSFETPIVRVTRFQNLTGIGALDEPVAGFARQLVADLSRFEHLSVELDNGTNVSQLTAGSIGSELFLLTGVARRTDVEVYFDILLSRLRDRHVIWTQTLKPIAMGADFPSSLSAMSQNVGAALGSFRGPLHVTARQRIAENLADYGEASAYVCQHLFSLARDEAASIYRDKALDCFSQLRNIAPDNAIGQAGWAGIRADILRDNAPLGERLADQLFDETLAARLAVELDPQSAIVRAELAEVLAVQSLGEEANQSFLEALQRNPANGDIRAEYALFLAYSGQWQNGQDEMNSVLEQVTASPPWYYELSAFEHLRNRDHEAALSDALIVVRGDPELGQILALSAAPLAARGDVVERYLQEVLDNPSFREHGILPWLSRRIADEEVLKLLTPGLQLAGVPIKAINMPFGDADY